MRRASLWINTIVDTVAQHGSRLPTIAGIGSVVIANCQKSQAANNTFDCCVFARCVRFGVVVRLPLGRWCGLLTDGRAWGLRSALFELCCDVCPYSCVFAGKLGYRAGPPRGNHPDNSVGPVHLNAVFFQAPQEG